MTINQTKIVALVPLRGGSKSIPDKNIKPIAGKPLCAWTLEAATKCSNIEEVYVSTDSDKIAQVVDCLNLSVNIIERPATLATDTASTDSVLLHFAENVEFDSLVTIQATSPLLTNTHLDQAIRQFLDSGVDSMLSAARSKRFFWNEDGTAINYDFRFRPRRQDFRGTLIENGAFYITKRNILVKNECRLGGRIKIFEMPEDTILEIDEPEDWRAVESILVASNR